MNEIQRKMIEAFDQGHLVYAANESEKIAFLTQCAAMDIKWQSGDGALEWIPGYVDIYFNISHWERYKITCTDRLEDSTFVNWADITGVKSKSAFAFNY